MGWLIDDSKQVALGWETEAELKVTILSDHNTLEHCTV